jgi:hypothetical protein
MLIYLSLSGVTCYVEVIMEIYNPSSLPASRERRQGGPRRSWEHQDAGELIIEDVQVRLLAVDYN